LHFAHLFEQVTDGLRDEPDNQQPQHDANQHENHHAVHNQQIAVARDAGLGGSERFFHDDRAVDGGFRIVATLATLAVEHGPHHHGEPLAILDPRALQYLISGEQFRWHRHHGTLHFLRVGRERHRAVGFDEATAPNLVRILQFLQEPLHLLMAIAEHDAVEVLVDERRGDQVLRLSALVPPRALHADDKVRVNRNDNRDRHADSNQHFRGEVASKHGRPPPWE